VSGNYGGVSLHREGHVSELRLCRPDSHNAFDAELIAALPDALRELSSDVETRAVVFTSTGKHFSAGGSVETMIAGHDDLGVLMAGVDDGRRLYRAFAGFSKPLVVALHGHVFGVATSIVLTADAVVTTADVKICDPHVAFGLVAGDGGCVSWPASAGLLRSKRQLLWGEPVTGAQAYEFGLVTDLVDSSDAVRDTAFDLARRVASLPPVAVQMTKRTLVKALGARMEEVLDTGFYLEAMSNRTDDVVEAVNAFKEKREPRWTGR
jgi:enoyl-CoA hydratase